MLDTTAAQFAHEEEVFSSGVIPLSFDDRRICPRLPVESITLWFEDGVFAGWGDVSTGGALWTGRPPRAPSGEVEVSLWLAGETAPLRLRAKVLSARPSGDALAVHLEFLDPDFDAERRIARHIDDCVLLSRGIVHS